MSSHELVLEGIASGYGQIEALHDLSLSVRSGEIVALLGRNGAGKSTAVRAISGLLPTWRGSITLDSEPLVGQAHDRSRQGVATVLDGKRVFIGLTVAQNLEVPIGPNSDRVRKQIQDLFPVLDQFANRRAGQLSGGQQQMLALAQALRTEPTVLILDEPSAGLAPLIVKELFGVLRKLADDGLAILLVEQLLGPTLRIADRATVINLGRVVGEWDVSPQTAPQIRASLSLTTTGADKSIG